MTLGVCGPNSFDERSLLGLAFHPRYAQNGLIYTYTSELWHRAPGAANVRVWQLMSRWRGPADGADGAGGC